MKFDRSKNSNKDCQIFISYRRRGGENAARVIQLFLQNCGYNVFLDFDNLHNGNFDEVLKSSIEKAPVFLLLLTKGCFDRCVNNDNDWIVQEVSCAAKSNSEIIPINYNRQYEGFPSGVNPSIIKEIKRHTYQEVFEGQLFRSSMQDLVENRIVPIIGGSSNTNITEVKFYSPNTNISFSIDNRKYGTVSRGEHIPVQLRAGDYIIDIVDLATGRNEQRILNLDGNSKSIVFDLSINHPTYTSKKINSNLSAEEYYNKGYNAYLNDQIEEAKIWMEKASALNYNEASVVLADCYLRENSKGNEEKAVELLKKTSDKGSFNATFKLAEFFEHSNWGFRDYEKSYLLYKQLANKGNAEALYRMAKLHFSQLLKHPNYKIAIDLLEKAAKKDHIDSLRQLGDIYKSGYGTEVDNSLAFSYYLRAAELNDTTCQKYVARFYLLDIEGIITGEERYSSNQITKYCKWRDKAAANGDVEMAIEASSYYMTKDIQKSIQFLQIAIAKNCPYALAKLAWIYEDYPHLNKGDEAFNLLSKAYELGYHYCASELANYYATGKFGVQIDYNEAYRLYREALNAGDANGPYGLGYIHEQGVLFGKDMDKAVAYYKDAANRGSHDAMYRLANMYFNGEHVEQSYEKAYELYYESSKGHDRSLLIKNDSVYKTALCQFSGFGTEINYKSAYEGFCKAARWGHIDAIVAIGDCYYYGKGVDQNYERAKYWYQIGADEKSVAAALKLEKIYSESRNPKSRRKALDVLKIAAEAGSDQAFNRYIEIAQKEGKGIFYSYLTKEESIYYKTLSDYYKDKRLESDWAKNTLNVLRESLGISMIKERLFSFILSNPPLTNEEISYIEEFKRCNSSGTITTNERHLLNQISLLYGFSDEKQQFLEDIASQNISLF